MEEIQRTESFDLAYQFVTETNLNVFLTGKAGTGKTTFLKYLREKSHKNIVVAAPTGVAAINAGGVTLHSLFQLPFAPFIPGKNKYENTLTGHSLLSQIKINNQKRKILKNMDLLVIDEVSMVASNTLDAIDTILKGVRKNYLAPFGGVQVLFIGDMYQLPPVVKSQDWSILKSYYPSVFFFDSYILREHPPVMVELKTIFRQKAGEFVDILNGVRNNTLTDALYHTLNSRLVPDFKMQEGYILLSTHNAQADKINQEKLDELESQQFIYSAEVKGDFPENMYPVDAEMQLKEGAQVMFTKNDVEDRKYFNGKIGRVVELTDNEIIVLSDGDDEVITVQKDTWRNVNYKVDPVSREVEEEELGTFVQYPLRLAWAITIHKSQGLTFDKLVVDAERAFASGQVYVALSRCRSLEGLVLTTPISKRFLGASNELIHWEQQHNKPEELEDKLENSRVEYIRQELLIAFEWSALVEDTNAIVAGTNKQIKKLPEEDSVYANELQREAVQLNNVAKNFQSNLNKIITHPDFVNNDNDLLKRLKDAADYFLDLLKDFQGKVYQHPFEIDTKAGAIELDEPIEELLLFLHDTIYRLEYFQKGNFDLSEYLENGKLNPKLVRKAKSAYLEKKVGSKNLTPVKDIPNLGLYQLIAGFRKEIADKSRVPVYKIFTNNAIIIICKKLPKTEEELLQIKGFGPVKVRQYGQEVLAIVKAYSEENGLIVGNLFD